MSISPNVVIMRTVKEFDYLIHKGEQITIDELRQRIIFCPSIIDEPDLQTAAQLIPDCDIDFITRNEMGYWYHFKH